MNGEKRALVGDETNVFELFLRRLEELVYWLKMACRGV